MKRIFAWLLCAAWMSVIYIMSAMPGDMSGGQSGLIVDCLLRAISYLFGKETAALVSADMLGFLVRKAAHMTEYAVLFLLYRRALVLSGVRRAGLAALILCACYAVTDEWHQGFVADRNPSPIDVGIDALGAALAWCIYAVWNRTAK